jgi:hypothetical protein
LSFGTELGDLRGGTHDRRPAPRHSPSARSNGSGQNLTKQGGGTLSIPSASNVWGDSNHTGRVLALGSTGAMGTGNIILAGGELNIQGRHPASAISTAARPPSAADEIPSR